MALFDSRRKVFGNGLIDAPEERREVVAAYENGDIFFARGKKFHSHVREAQNYVRKTLGGTATLKEVSAREVMTHYEAVASARTRRRSEGYERLADRILLDAANAKAADIKIIRTPERTVVRLIIAGQEIDYGVPVTSLEGNALISYIFDNRDEGAGHSTKVRGEFQGFSVSNAGNKSGGPELPRNVLKLRCQKGFHETSGDIMDHLAVRVFYRESDEMASLEDLGLDPVVLAALRRAREGMKGATIIGGETGGGKSTTLISTLKRQYDENGGRISIVTVEDPVEYKLDEPGIVQIPLRSAGDAEQRRANYRAALMHFVRINPHVGMISEMRDAEAARQVLQFIETGHQVWTTIHINSANSIPFRLIDMGIEPTELSKPDSLKLLMKQTLVPLLCRCAVSAEDGGMRRNPAGCPVCRSGASGAEAESAWSGFSRLVALAEFIEPDDAYLGMIRANDAVGARNYWERPEEDGGMGGVALGRKLRRMVRLGAVDPATAVKKGMSASGGEAADGAGTDDIYSDWIGGLLDGRRSR